MVGAGLNAAQNIRRQDDWIYFGRLGPITNPYRADYDL